MAYKPHTPTRHPDPVWVETGMNFKKPQTALEKTEEHQQWLREVKLFTNLALARKSQIP